MGQARASGQRRSSQSCSELEARDDRAGNGSNNAIWQMIRSFDKGPFNKRASFVALTGVTDAGLKLSRFATPAPPPARGLLGSG